LWFRRFYLWSLVVRPEVPVHSLSWLPDGFFIQPIGGTDICVIDGFCTPTESEQLGAEDARTMNPLEHRAAMVAGLSRAQLQSMGVQSIDGNSAVVFNEFSAASSCSFGMCVFLDSGEFRLRHKAAGKTVDIEARAGRAVCWFVQEGQSEVGVVPTSSAAGRLPVLLLSFSSTASKAVSSVVPKQSQSGRALSGNESLPEGVWAPGQGHLEAIFGKPDQLTDLVNREQKKFL
jgi:hypothetical protein